MHHVTHVFKVDKIFERLQVQKNNQIGAFATVPSGKHPFLSTLIHSLDLTQHGVAEQKKRQQ